MKTSKQDELKSNHKESEFMIKKSKIKKLVLLSSLMMALLAGCSTGNDTPVKEERPIIQKQPATDEDIAKLEEMLGYSPEQIPESMTKNDDFGGQVVVLAIQGNKNLNVVKNKWFRLDNDVKINFTNEVMKEPGMLMAVQSYLFEPIPFTSDEVDSVKDFVLLYITSTAPISEKDMVKDIIAPLVPVDDIEYIAAVLDTGFFNKANYKAYLEENLIAMSENSIQKSRSRL